MNTDFILQSLPTLFIALYIVQRTMHVVEGDLPLGTFLATISVIKMIGDTTWVAYVKSMGIARTFNPLRSVATFLAKPTGLQAMKSVNRARRSTTNTKIDAFKFQAD